MVLSETRRNWQWYAIFILSVVFFGLGLEGVFRYAAWHNLAYSFWDDLYSSLQLISLNSGPLEQPVPVELNLARFLLPALAGTAAIKAIWDVFRVQIRAFRLQGLRGHVVVCGLSRKGFLLAMEFRRQGYDVVVIEEDDENDWLESCRDQMMYVLVGDATDPALLNQARVAQALGLFAVCDDDGINAELVVRVQELADTRAGRSITLVAHISDPQLCLLLREKEEGLKRDGIHLELFNIYERGAQSMLRQYPAWDGAGRAPDGQSPRILLVGMGRMGENLVTYAARDWYTRHSSGGAHLAISVIDRQADRKTASLLVRYPQLAKICDLSPLSMELRSAEFEGGGFLFDPDGRLRFNILYICLDNDSLALQAGLRLTANLRGHEAPVVVRMSEATGLARLLDDAHDTRDVYHNLAPFSLLEPGSLAGLLTLAQRDILAQAAYEEQLALPQGWGNAVEPPSTGVRNAWDNLDQTGRESWLSAIDRLTRALGALGFRIVPLVDWEAPSRRFSDADVERMAAFAHDLYARYHTSGHSPLAPIAGLSSQPPQAGEDWEQLPEPSREEYRGLMRVAPAFLGRSGYQLAAG